MAETYNVFMAPHSPLGPINLAASLQLDFATPNFLIQEQVLGLGNPGTESNTHKFVDYGDFKVKDGYVELMTKPGLGIEVDEAAVAYVAANTKPWRAPEGTGRDGALAGMLGMEAEVIAARQQRQVQRLGVHAEAVAAQSDQRAPVPFEVGAVAQGPQRLIARGLQPGLDVPGADAVTQLGQFLGEVAQFQHERVPGEEAVQGVLIGQARRAGREAAAMLGAHRAAARPS